MLEVAKQNLDQNLENQSPVTREKLLAFEKLVASQPNAFLGDSENCPLKHSFCEGMYVREIFIPAGTIYTGAIHKYSHPRFLLKGELVIATEEGMKTYKAPMSMITIEGTKRAGYAKTDCTIVTVHLNPNNITDVNELRKEITTDNYKELDEFLTQNKIKNNILKSKEELVNCGLIALGKMCELKNSSVASLISLAKDNGIILNAYRVPLEELKKVPLPAIFHSDNHFIHIEKGQVLPDEKYTGVVLSVKELKYQKVEDCELSNITGHSFIVVGVALAGAGATVFGAVKGAQNTATNAAAAQAQAAAALQAAQVQAAAQASDDAAKATRLKWILIGGGALLLTGIIILVATRKKPTIVVESGVAPKPVAAAPKPA